MADASGDTRPIPDPTVLTTEASIRLEAMLRNLITAEIIHQRVLFDEKLRKNDVRFDMLELRVAEQKQDTAARTAEQKQDVKSALDAALAAQKEAVASQTASSEKSITKSETATIERIKAVETLLSADRRASDDKIDDLKSRIVAIEAVKLGNVEGATGARQGGSESRAILASVVSVIIALIAIASILVAILKP